MIKVRFQDNKGKWYDDIRHNWKNVSVTILLFSKDWVATAGNDYGDDVEVIVMPIFY